MPSTTRRPAPPPGQGSALDGGAPWDSAFDAFLSGIRMVTVGDHDTPIHIEVYVVDPYGPDGGEQVTAAGQTICGLPGPYWAPTRALPQCPTCRDGVPAALAALRPGALGETP